MTLKKLQDETRGTSTHILWFVLSVLSLSPRSILRCHEGQLDNSLLIVAIP